MKARVILAGLALHCGAAGALAPEDFARGMSVEGDPQSPVWQLELPDAVYAAVLRPGLGDLRVFNTDRIAVPHAICSQAETEEASLPQGREVELPVFPLQSIREQAVSSVDVNLTAPQGSDVHIDIESAEPVAEETLALSGYVIDASALDASIVALRLRWISGDGASEVPVRIEASQNLDQWSVVIPQANLLRLTSASATLERFRITLPPARYKYLRLVRVNEGPAPAVEAVIAETVEPTKVKALPLRWFDAQARTDAPEAMFDYEAGRLAPVQAARVALPVRNQLVTLSLQSRANDQAVWQTRWQGQQSNIEQAEDRRSTADIFFPASSDPQWRLHISEGREAFGDDAPTLSLGYAPEVLRFIAQGEGPFTLAYGSANAESAPRRACDWWRQTSGGDAGVTLGFSSVGEEFVLGGMQATQPLPVPTPLKRYLLWGVLLVAAALLVVMALSLLRKVRAPD